MKRVKFSWELFSFAFMLMILAGCKPGSIAIKGYDCKMNGSYETLNTGLPANWWYYAMETVQKGDFDILSDSLIYKEGKRSLKFQVRECESTGGRLSPGYFGEFKVKPGEIYRISFWVINSGCDSKVSVGTGMEGNPGPSETILKTREAFSEWKYFDYIFAIPLANDNIRFEANILSAGTIWFDAIRIEGMNDKKELTMYPYKGYEECK